MKGWRTLAFNIAAAVAAVLVAYNWSDVLSPEYAWIGTIIVTVANIALRLVTTTPVGLKSHDALWSVFLAAVIVLLSAGLASKVNAHEGHDDAACASTENVLAMVQSMPGFIAVRVFNPDEVHKINKQLIAEGKGQPMELFATLVLVGFKDQTIMFLGNEPDQVCEYFEVNLENFRAFLSRALGQPA